MVKLFLSMTILNVYILMVAGNIVTTTGSGLDCPDWPFCYGSVLPPLEVGIWIEWSHRLLGGLAGLLLLATNVVVWHSGHKSIRKLSLTALALLGVGTLFGGWIVLSEAPLLTEFFHIVIISFHIIIASTIFIVLIFAYRTQRDPNEKQAPKFYTFLFILVVAQVLIGIYVRYSQASLACPDFPLCRGLFFPELIDSKVTLHFFHRLLALVIFFVTAGYLVFAIKKGEDVRNAVITFLLVVAQGTFGAYIVWTGMFLPFIVLHGANGFLILGWLAYHVSSRFTTSSLVQGEIVA